MNECLQDIGDSYTSELRTLHNCYFLKTYCTRASTYSTDPQVIAAFLWFSPVRTGYSCMLAGCPTLAPSRAEERRCLCFAKKHSVHSCARFLKLLHTGSSWAGILYHFDSMLLASATTRLQAASKLETPMSYAVFISVSLCQLSESRLPHMLNHNCYENHVVRMLIISWLQ